MDIITKMRLHKPTGASMGKAGDYQWHRQFRRSWQQQKSEGIGRTYHGGHSAQDAGQWKTDHNGGGERLLPPDTMEIANSVMNDTQKQRFEDKGEVDMSFAIAGEGRYRVNVYKAARLGSPGISSGGHSRAFAGGAGRARICH